MGLYRSAALGGMPVLNPMGSGSFFDTPSSSGSKSLFDPSQARTIGVAEQEAKVPKQPGSLAGLEDMGGPKMQRQSLLAAEISGGPKMQRFKKGTAYVKSKHRMGMPKSLLNRP